MGGSGLSDNMLVDVGGSPDCSALSIYSAPLPSVMHPLWKAEGQLLKR